MNTSLENSLVHGFVFFAIRYGNFRDLDFRKASLALCEESRIQGLCHRHISPTELMDNFYRNSSITIFSGTGFMNNSQIARLTVEEVKKNLEIFILDLDD